MQRRGSSPAFATTDGFCLAGAATGIGLADRIAHGNQLHPEQHAHSSPPPSPALSLDWGLSASAGWGGQSTPPRFGLDSASCCAHAAAMEPPSLPKHPAGKRDGLPALAPDPDTWRPESRAWSPLLPLASRSPKREREQLGVLESPPSEDESVEPLDQPPPRRARSSSWQRQPPSPVALHDVSQLLDAPLFLTDASPFRRRPTEAEACADVEARRLAEQGPFKGSDYDCKSRPHSRPVDLKPLDHKGAVPSNWSACGAAEQPSLEEAEQELRAVPLEPVAPPPSSPGFGHARGRAAVEEEVRLAALALERTWPAEVTPATVHASVAWPWKKSQFVREPVPELVCGTVAEVASAAFGLFQTRGAAQVRVVWLEGASSSAGKPGESAGVPAVPFIQLNPFGADDVDRAIACEVGNQPFVMGKGGKRSRSKLCTVCGSSKSNLSRHLREHMGIVHVCGVPSCGRVFRGGVRGNLAPHAKEHLCGLH